MVTPRFEAIEFVRQPPTGIRPCDFGIPSPYYSLMLTTKIKV
jgi:hypothetical protein